MSAWTDYFFTLLFAFVPVGIWNQRTTGPAVKVVDAVGLFFTLERYDQSLLTTQLDPTVLFLVSEALYAFHNLS